jgi:hypothetical protein
MTIETLLSNARSTFDLREPRHQESLYTLTEALLEMTHLTSEALNRAGRRPDTPLEFKLAAKLVDSRQYLFKAQTPLNIGVVYAMWGEHSRLLPKSKLNPNGEDSLRTKIKQLDWVTKDTPLDWTLYGADDGCPHESGKIALQVIETHPLKNKVKVLFLNDAVPTPNGPLRALRSADASRKAGAIILGCMQAVSDGKDAVIYTDADNSVHLGQI